VIGIDEDEGRVHTDTFVAITERVIGNQMKKVSRGLIDEGWVQQLAKRGHRRLGDGGFECTRIKQAGFTTHVFDQAPMQVQDLFDGEKSRAGAISWDVTDRALAEVGTGFSHGCASRR